MNTVTIIALIYLAAVAGFVGGLMWNSALKESYRGEAEELQLALATESRREPLPRRRTE